MGNNYNAERHEYQMDGQIVPGVTEIINHFFPIYSGIKDLEWYKNRGKAVHKACELYDLGVLDYRTVDNEVLPYLKGWEACKKALKIEVIGNETVMFSKSFRFGGTRDKLAMVNGKLTLIEIKATSVIHKKKLDLQTGSYALLHDAGKKFKDKIKQRWGIQLKKDTFRLFECKNKSDEQEFLCLLTTYNLQKREGII